MNINILAWQYWSSLGPLESFFSHASQSYIVILTHMGIKQIHDVTFRSTFRATFPTRSRHFCSKAEKQRNKINIFPQGLLYASIRLDAECNFVVVCMLHHVSAP